MPVTKLAFLLMATVALAGDALAQERTEIETSFSLRMDCERPMKRMNQAVSGSGKFVLLTSGNSSVDYRIKSVLTQRVALSGRLGATADIPGGRAELRVAGQNSLILNWHMPQNTVQFRVVVSGRSCTFSVASVLNRGFTEHTLWSGFRYYYCSPPREIRTTCRIH